MWKLPSKADTSRHIVEEPSAPLPVPQRPPPPVSALQLVGMRLAAATAALAESQQQEPQEQQQQQQPYQPYQQQQSNWQQPYHQPYQYQQPYLANEQPCPEQQYYLQLQQQLQQTPPLLSDPQGAQRELLLRRIDEAIRYGSDCV